MKFQYLIWLLLYVLFLSHCPHLNTVFSQSQTESKMLNTKHNLGIGGSGTIKATSETDICVFCHTPHVPRQYSAIQLWNQQMSTADYTLYSSEYLTNLGYASPSQPNLRSKLCLSCHDGTVAVGAVYNIGGSSQTILMQNNVTTIPSDAAGYISTSLRNDHPVGFIYDNSKDLELVSRPWPWKTQIKLDPDAPSGTLECITCHEPHDNSYGKFLRVENTNAFLCKFCHSKTGWQTSVHQTSMQSYTPSEGTTTIIGEWACRNCHQSHGGKGVPYLLKAEEENTCFASGCHGNTLTGSNTKDIQTQYGKNYMHPTVSVAGKHRNPDDASSLGSDNRHAECQDCHNSHRAQKGLHTVGSNLSSNVLLGALGILPGPASRWEQPMTFTEMKPATQENQICFKCHSAYAFGNVPNGVTAITGPSGGFVTDQAMEFNPANGSAHPVRVSLNDQSGSPIPKALGMTQLSSIWNSPGNQTMYCSDCHGNDQPVSSSNPQGPHGSNSKFMLTGTAKYWPTNPLENIWSLDDVKNNRYNWQNDLFCTNCHPIYSDGMWKNNVHSKHSDCTPCHQSGMGKTKIRDRSLDNNTKTLTQNDHGMYCITCHVVIPHGSNNSRLIGYASDVPPYNYSGSGIYDKLVVTDFQKAIGPLNYEKNNCSMNGICHDAPRGLYRR